LLNLLINPLNFKIMELAVVNLGDLNLEKLNTQEIQEIDGGNVFRVVSWIIDFAAAYDAIGDFKAGWNSVPGNQVSSGSW
jgi:hypothetical protein